MALKVLDESIENVWLADHERCDVVICVVEKSNVGPASKKRVNEMSDCGGDITNCAVTRYCLHLGKRTIRLHARSEALARSPYFETCLKETWCKQNGKEGSLVELPLETLVASSKAYQRCIEILCSSEPCSPHMFSQPLEALDIYLASDHLLFKECSAACMEYLAAAPWSTAEMRAISETFSTSGIEPSEDLVARLGLPKEECSKNFSRILWQTYCKSYFVDEPESDEPRLGETDKLDQFENLIKDLLRGLESKDGMNLRKKIAMEFLYKATDDCLVKLKDVNYGGADDWIHDNHFRVWLYMIQLIMDISDGKKAVEAMALNQSLQERFLSTFGNILAEHDRCVCLDIDRKYYYQVQYIRSVNNVDLSKLVEMAVRVVKLVAEAFKRVAEMNVIVPEATRNCLIMSWVPWFEKHRTNEKIYESVDMAALKVHISKILQTLSMNDEKVLGSLAEGALNGDYFLEGAFEAWFDRLD